MMLKTKSKNQKPIEVEVSLRYTCPDKNCNLSHWIFLREAQTKNFKIVCECGTVFKPKRIKKIEILYTSKEIEDDVSQKTNSKEEYPKCVLHAVNIMVSLGYSKKESQEKIKEIYDIEKITDSSILVKRTISQFGEIK